MQPAKTYNYNGPYHDDRKGLGYGQIKNRFHKPRQSGSDYPYKTDDYEDSEFEDEETELAINKKVPVVYATDFGAAAGTDPFYFAAGNVKLSDAFFRTDQLIEAMSTFSDSICELFNSILFFSLVENIFLAIFLSPISLFI